METSVVVILVVSCMISFALGRTFVYFRDKKKKKAEETLKALARRRSEDRADEPEAMNKAKRRRQLQQAAKVPGHKR